MNLSQLRYFASVAEYRSFTKAAEHQHVAQTAVSRQVKKLEDELECPLFERTTRDVALTETGLQFYKEVKLALNTLDRAIDTVRATRILASRDFSVGFTSLLDCSALTQIVKRIIMNNQDTLITLYHSDSAKHLVSEIKSGNVDIALFFAFTAWDQSGCEWEDLGIVPGKVLCPLNHPFSGRKFVSIQEFDQEKTISTRDIIGSTPSPQYPSLENVRVAEDIESLVKMVEIGIGVALLPIIDPQKYTDRISVVPLEYTDDGPRLLAVWKKGNDSPIIPQFISMARRLSGTAGE